MRAVEGGPRAALLDLVPRGDAAAWGWTNLLAVVVALLAWPAAATVVLKLRKAR
ncbi:MAG: hypothetical protein U0599_17565 [Vicinamibacteria bacterium]